MWSESNDHTFSLKGIELPPHNTSISIRLIREVECPWIILIKVIYGLMRQGEQQNVKSHWRKSWRILRL